MSPVKPTRDDTTTFWRSAERAGEGSERLPEELRPEFPDGADRPPDGLTRRTVMGLMGASLAMTTAACRRPEEHIVPYVQAPPEVVPGIPRRYATTLPMGTTALGVVVESHEGRPGKVEGNPLHPASMGAASAWAQASILALYDPDRARRPARRELPGGVDPTGPTGAVGQDEENPEPGEGTDRAPVEPADTGEPRAAPPLDDVTWEDFDAFWAERLSEAGGAGETGDGSRVAVLLEPWSSPTQTRMVRRLQQRLPGADVVVWGPSGEENVFEGIERATGRAQRPLPRFDRAKVVLTLDADPFLTEGDAVANARGWAVARGLADPWSPRSGERSVASPRRRDGIRLYSVESTPTLTGASADYRLRLQARQMPAFVAALGRSLGAPAGDTLGLTGELPPDTQRHVDNVARELRQAGSGALVLAGRRLPPEVHAAVHRLNVTLGAVGGALEMRPLTDVGWGRTDDLAALADKARAGGLDTLVILGGNPVYHAPADLDLPRALARVAHVVQLSPTQDETSGYAHWHLPEAHPFETWGDARSADGTASVIQPLVDTLFTGKSVAEVLGRMSRPDGAEPETALALVQGTWGLSPESAAWRRLLHDGVASGGVAPGGGTVESTGADEMTAGERTTGGPEPEALAADAEPAPDLPPMTPPAPRPRTRQRPADAGGLELVFTASSQVGDGRWANVAWLQETPDPLTRLTWENALLVSPATAAELEIESGDRVALRVAGRDGVRLEAPVLVMPGQADGTLALAVGYGRRGAGRVGDGRGVDTAPLRSSLSPWHATGVEVERVGGGYDLARTQEHWAMEGRDLVREGVWDEVLGAGGTLTMGAAHRAGHGAEGHGADVRAGEHGEEHEGAEEHGEEHVDDGHGGGHDVPTELWEPPELTGEYQWGMVIDLAACTGCGACAVACQSENNIPVVGKEQVLNSREMAWMRIDRYFTGPVEDPQVVFQPMLCQHCENAPCEQVCPVAATVHDAEGLNLMIYNRCIGTRYCSNNCPYKVRRFNFFNYTRDTPELVALAMNPDVTVRSRGVMEKCTFCTQRIQEAKISARRDGRELADGDVVTACQQTCPTRAITFGDVSDPTSAVSRAKADPRNYVVLEDLRNEPRTSYLSNLRHPRPGGETVTPSATVGVRG
jgi:Fe-S-cluster-containing dehydrogenase component